MNLFKICNTCQIEKPFTEFGRQAATRDGHKYACQSCENIKNAALYRDNPEIFKHRALKWQKTNPEKIKVIRRRLSQNPLYKIKKHHNIKGPRQVLKSYLESLFTSGMSWDNYGTVWQVAHVKTRKECDSQGLDYNDIRNLIPQLRVPPQS